MMPWTESHRRHHSTMSRKMFKRYFKSLGLFQIFLTKKLRQLMRISQNGIWGNRKLPAPISPMAFLQKCSREWRVFVPEMRLHVITTTQGTSKSIRETKQPWDDQFTLPESDFHSELPISSNGSELVMGWALIYQPSILLQQLLCARLKLNMMLKRRAMNSTKIPDEVCGALTIVSSIKDNNKKKKRWLVTQ